VIGLKKTFRGGVHPLRQIGEGKPLTKRMPRASVIPDVVVIPVGMHLARRALLAWKKGSMSKWAK
jgi:hypothetical protein